MTAKEIGPIQTAFSEFCKQRGIWSAVVIFMHVDGTHGALTHNCAGSPSIHSMVMKIDEISKEGGAEKVVVPENIN